MNKLVSLDVSGKRVFLRADLDVSITNSNDQTPNSNVDAVTRLTNIKPTVDWLAEHGALQIIIAGHIDRPKGPDPTKSTKNLVAVLEKILGQKIAFSEQLTINNSQLTEKVVLLENLRFWEGEEKNDMEFAKQLANLADCYVNEAFGNSHREHASMVALPELFRHVEDSEHCRRAAGLHLEQEVSQLSRLSDSPEKPFIAIVGGAKIETKLPVISNLSKIADRVLVGGELPVEIKKNSQAFEQNVTVAILTSDNKDISGESAKQFAQIISDAKTVVWNGPMGLFEEGKIDGTLAVADAIAKSSAYSVIGGGESTQFLGSHGLLSKFSFVSAGGGAMLEFLAGKELPGIRALE